MKLTFESEILDLMPEENLPNLTVDPATEKPDVPSPTVVKNEKPGGRPHILKFVLLGIITALTITGIAGAYVMGKNSNSQATETQVGNSITPTPDPTSDWKTYTNPELGFSIKYPSEDFIRLGCPDEGLVLEKRTPDNAHRDEEPLETCGRDSLFDIEVQKRDSNPNYKEDNNYSVKSENMNFNGKSVIKYTIAVKSTCYGFCGFEWRQEVIIPNDGSFYILYLTNKDYVNQFDQMLSTFKIINSTNLNSPTPTDSMSSWKKYNDINYPFSIQYPSDWKLRTTYGKSVNNTNNYRVAGIDITNDPSYGSTVIINVIDSQGMSFDEWVEKYSGFGSSVPQKPNYTYKNNPAYRYTTEGSGGRKVTIITYPYKDKIIYLEWHIFDYDQNTADKIMDSLKLN